MPFNDNLVHDFSNLVKDIINHALIKSIEDFDELKLALNSVINPHEPYKGSQFKLLIDDLNFLFSYKGFKQYTAFKIASENKQLNTVFTSETAKNTDELRQEAQLEFKRIIRDTIILRIQNLEKLTFDEKNKIIIQNTEKGSTADKNKKIMKESLPPDQREAEARTTNETDLEIAISRIHGNEYISPATRELLTHAPYILRLLAEERITLALLNNLNERQVRILHNSHIQNLLMHQTIDPNLIISLNDDEIKTLSNPTINILISAGYLIFPDFLKDKEKLVILYEPTILYAFGRYMLSILGTSERALWSSLVVNACDTLITLAKDPQNIPLLTLPGMGTAIIEYSSVQDNRAIAWFNSLTAQQKNIYLIPKFDHSLLIKENSI